VHARFHDARADGVRVAEAREVADGIKIHFASCVLGLFNEWRMKSPIPQGLKPDEFLLLVRHD
jgi:hypothetical protein